MLFFFDGGFDERADEYADRYRVYKLGPESRKITESESWQGLEDTGALVAEIPVNNVRFDATRRAAIDDRVFDLF